MSHLSRWIFGVALAATIVAVVAAPAPAVVPPVDCGPMEVDGKRYKIKADQLRCKKARKYALTYLRGSGKPRGYKCQDGEAGSKLEFRCYNGIKEFFAIRRRG
jgi:hypothetical protein